MLTLDQAQEVADQINARARAATAAFVLENSGLAQDEFEKLALQRLEKYCREVRVHLAATDREWGEIDELRAQAIWKAIWRQYHAIAGVSGNA